MSNTPRRPAAQAPRRTVPKPHDLRALAVCDGTVGVGTIIPKDGTFYAYDITGTLVGKYPTQREAMRAIPKSSGESRAA